VTVDKVAGADAAPQSFGICPIRIRNGKRGLPCDDGYRPEPGETVDDLLAQGERVRTVIARRMIRERQHGDRHLVATGRVVGYIGITGVEKIPSSGNGPDRQGTRSAESLTDLPDRLRQRVLRDDHVRPNRIHQIDLRDDSASTFGEEEKQFERLAAEGDGSTILQQQSTVEVERKFVEMKYRARVRPHRRLTSD